MRLVTRPPVKQDEIVEHLRGKIVKGDLKPGERLPTRLDIEEQFMVSSLTVQRAFDRLIEDGFITASGRKGTFVSEAPPHLHHFALSFPQLMGDLNWVKFWSVLIHVAREIEKQGEYRISIFQGINKVVGGEDYHALTNAVCARRLAGIFFATNPFVIAGTPILDLPGIPRVAMMGRSEFPGVAAISFLPEDFIRRAVKHLAAQGRKRIGFILVPGFTSHAADMIQRVLAGQGLAYQPLAVQMALQSEAGWVSNLTQMMVKGAPGERPDGLVIVDDNLTEYACAGVLQAGIQAPRELEVVAHCNFPSPAPNLIPVTRLGYDIFELFHTCIQILERQRNGETFDKILLFSPKFEGEVRVEHRLAGMGAM